MRTAQWAAVVTPEPAQRACHVELVAACQRAIRRQQRHTSPAAAGLAAEALGMPLLQISASRTDLAPQPLAKARLRRHAQQQQIAFDRVARPQPVGVARVNFFQQPIHLH